MTTRYYAAMTPTRERPILRDPAFKELLSGVEGLVVDNGGIQSFWPAKGSWGPAGPSTVAAVLGDASDIYLTEVTEAQAKQLFEKLSPTATLPI